MDLTDEKTLIYKIVGCGYEVLNEIGHGLREKTYERAMILELTSKGFKTSSQFHYNVYYKEKLVDTYIPDIEINDTIILEIKTVESIIYEHVGQVLNYLKVAEKRTGLILNFKHPKLQWYKVTMTN